MAFEAGDGGHWDPPWRQQPEGVGGAYSQPPAPPPMAQPPPAHGPWGDPAGWNASSYPVPQQPPVPPPAIRTASALMFVGAGLTVLSAVVFFATTERYAEALAEASDFRSRISIDREVDQATGQELVRTMLGVGLWIWMAVKNGQGRKWARVVATVFGVINVVGFALGGALLSGIDSSEMLEYMLPQLILGGITVLLGVVILVHLHGAAASRFYEESTRYQAAMTLRGYR
jgi:hypothetical protein